MLLTANRELRTTSDELEKISSLFGRVLAHGGEQVANALAVQVVAMIGLDRIHES